MPKSWPNTANNQSVQQSKNPDPIKLTLMHCLSTKLTVFSPNYNLRIKTTSKVINIILIGLLLMKVSLSINENKKLWNS